MQATMTDRERICAAPGCGKAFTPRRPTSRFCSNRCKTSAGPWSYPSNEHAPIIYRGAEGV